MIGARMWRFTTVWLALPLAAVCFGAEAAAADRSCTMRVESELFADDASEPVARSLTLFANGVAWDFLELPAEAGGPGTEADAQANESPALRLAEIVLHDPARQRVVVIDPRRDVKTQVETLRLERLSVSLARWARGSDDRLVRWAGGPDFDAGLKEKEDALELVGPRVRYAVAYHAAPSPAAAAVYREFADTAILLKALLHPGGLPPFPRLALNRRLENAAAIPAEVTLEIDPKLSLLPGSSRLRCVHRLHPRLLAADGKRIEEAEARIAAAALVDVAAFADRTGE
jgi:hypothetical protein